MCTYCGWINSFPSGSRAAQRDLEIHPAQEKHYHHSFIPCPYPQVNFIREFWRPFLDTCSREQNEGKEGNVQAPLPSHGEWAMEPSVWMRLALYSRGAQISRIPCHVSVLCQSPHFTKMCNAI